MKLIVILVVALVLLIIVGLIIRNRQLRAIIAGSEDPELLLPRSERRERARKKLQRLDEEELDRRYHEMINNRKVN